jgi:hypothetical protein
MSWNWRVFKNEHEYDLNKATMMMSKFKPSQLKQLKEVELVNGML